MSLVKIEIKNSVMHFTLNRPDVHNAFNPQMIAEIKSAIQGVGADIRAVVLSGAGPSFCAGGDLEWMKSMANYTFDQNLKDADVLFEMFDSLRLCPVPLIGKIHGNVMGGGVGLVSICDIVAAESKTQFCLSEVKLGLVPSVISPFVLAKVGYGAGLELGLTAKVFNSDKAMQVGLIQYQGSSNDVDLFVNEQIKLILSAGPEAVRETKKLFQHVRTSDWSQVRKSVTKVIAERRVSSEGQEGLKSFFEKRKPSWIAAKKG